MPSVRAKPVGALGIDYTLLSRPSAISQRELKLEIRRLNSDPAVTGIMMHLPLPDHLDTARLQYEIDVLKDVEGVNPANIGYVVYRHTLIAPCTALAAVELIKQTGVPLRGAEVCVVGASVIVGKPIALLLTEQEATVTVCHIATRDLAFHTRRADVVVVAVGKPGLIRGDDLKEGAVVIDVGINRVTQPGRFKKNRRRCRPGERRRPSRLVDAGAWRRRSGDGRHAAAETPCAARNCAPSEEFGATPSAVPSSVAKPMLRRRRPSSWRIPRRQPWVAALSSTCD